jgi:uncharacterized alpha-E superfamily protein
MLSRVAESLYWAARYLERAEDVTRLLDVNFHRLLDAQLGDSGEAWREIVALLGHEEAYGEHFDAYTARNASEWVLWHEGNEGSVASCVTRARENARAVREQISAEMWQAVNRLFLTVRSARPGSVSPHAFFTQLREGVHLFHGAADATMMHGDPYDFIQLGLHLERADMTVRVVAARYPVAAELADDDPRRPGELAAMLRSTGAFEAYVRQHGMRLEPLAIAEELIRSPILPRSALHCLSICLGAVDRIGGGENDLPHRLLGRLCADLEYGEVDDRSGAAVARALSGLRAGIAGAGEAITKSFFSSRPLVAAVAQQEAQQQQCG